VGSENNLQAMVQAMQAKPANIASSCQQKIIFVLNKTDPINIKHAFR